jgi:hypothetical protein
MLCALPASSRELLVGSSRILKVPNTEGTGPGRHDRVRWRCRAHRSRHLCRLRDLARVTIADRVRGRRRPDRWQNLCRGIFVTAGSDTTVRGITFADASVIWHNGAAIRASGAT